MQMLIDQIADGAREVIGRGKVADYIPALACIPADKFGMAICGVDGSEYVTGDADETFSIQSISKVFTLVLALRSIGSTALWKRVGREPSGNAFNSNSGAGIILESCPKTRPF